MSTAKKAPKNMEDIHAALQNLIAQGKKDGMIRASDLNAQLEKMDGEWNLIDLNSLNGTYKNGERLVGNIANRLENKDVIFLADERFIYYA